MSEEDLLQKLKESVIKGDEKEAKRLAEEVIGKGFDPVRAIVEGLTKGIEVIGAKFEKLEIFLPDVMLAADAMKAAMRVLKPSITGEQARSVKKGVVVIGTCRGDIHDIGKNLVSAMLEAAGYEVYDLGIDVPVQNFISKAEEVKADIIGLSALLSTSTWYQRDLIKNLNDMDVREKYWVIVGGGATTPEFTRKILADGYGKFANDAIKLCNLLATERPIPPLHEPVMME